MRSHSASRRSYHLLHRLWSASAATAAAPQLPGTVLNFVIEAPVVDWTSGSGERWFDVLGQVVDQQERGDEAHKRKDGSSVDAHTRSKPTKKKN